MKLFPENPENNLLPYNGKVNYYGIIVDETEANYYFDKFMDGVKWEYDEAIIYGKRITTTRKVAWYGSKRFTYRYSGTTKFAFPWTQDLLRLKQLVELKTGETYNSCLLNLYHNGSEGMGWHSDGETDLKKNGAIASVTFGAERKFAFKHKKTKETVALTLEHGSLLVMKDETQTYWFHRLPPTKKILKPRINLTFRTIDQGEK